MPEVRAGFYFADGSDFRFAPEGPGWYLYATEVVVTGDGERDPIRVPAEIIPRVRLTGEEVVKLAKVIENFSNGKPLNPSQGVRRSERGLEQAVAEDNELIKTMIERELAEAERAVRNMQLLQARLQEFQEKDKG